MKLYRAWLRSTPGFYAQYDGHVDVWCETDDWDEIFRAAVKQLQRTSFPDRSALSWKLVDFQPLRCAA